jgi:MATE family multidrug resistance protein
VWLALLTSVPVMLVTAGLAVALPSLGVNPEVAESARRFMWWRLGAAPGVLLFIGVRSYLQGLGRASVALWGTVLANVLNLGLDLVLVFGAGPIPSLGVAGAALATVASTWAQLGLLVLAVGPAPPGVRRAPQLASLLHAARIGVPVGLHFIAESGVFSLTGVLAGRLGPVESAAHQAALTWASLTFSVATGIGSAAATRVGWAVGAGQRTQARAAGISAFWSVTGFMLLASVALLVAPRALAGVMSSDPRVISVVVSLVTVAAVFQVSDGLQAVGAGALRGAGETGYTFRANVLGHWLIGLPVAVVLGFGFGLGVVGLWWGLSAGLTGVAVALVLRFLKRLR